MNIKQGDFFKLPNNTKYDHIFLNPPYTSGYSKKDNYYVKFVLKLLQIMDETASNNKGVDITAQLIIPPKFLSSIKENTPNGETIDFGTFLDKVPKAELKRYLKELKIDEDEALSLVEINCQFLGLCSFETTNFKIANLLLSIKKQ